MLIGFKTTYKGKPTEFPAKILAGTKIHTLRKGQRWKAGRSIQMATGVRSKDYHKFNETVCTGTQEITMEFHTALNGLDVMVFIDHRELSDDEVRELARNDGFDTVGEFIDWFRQDFDGQIIHWTDFRY